MTTKALLSLVAIFITIFAFYPFIKLILQGKVKPHVFSWVIWGSTTFIAFLAQYNAKGGIGTIPIGISGLITLFVAFLAFKKRGDISISKLDWLFLIMAFSSLPFWYLTSNPLWAVIILTTADLLGFGPTLRKAFYYPFEENIHFYFLFAARNALSIAALETYSLTTVLFPASIALTCLLLIAVLVVRRSISKF